jgi:hypothetical protein
MVGNRRLGCGLGNAKKYNYDVKGTLQCTYINSTLDSGLFRMNGKAPYLIIKHPQEKNS